MPIYMQGLSQMTPAQQALFRSLNGSRSRKKKAARSMGNKKRGRSASSNRGGAISASAQGNRKVQQARSTSVGRKKYSAVSKRSGSRVLNGRSRASSTVRPARLVKGSPAAKRYMAKLRAMRK